MPSTAKTSRLAVFLVILVLSFATRFWGLGWGLPNTYHVDENWFAGKAANFLEGNLDPKFFDVPTLHMYTLAGLWKVYFLIEKAGGQVRTAAEFRDTLIQNPTVFYLIGRALSALMGIGTILLLYLLGKRMYGPRAGAIAALMLVFALDHARISHDMLPDVPMVFFLVLSYLCIWNVAEKGRTRDYLWAGVAAGLAMTTKYGGLAMFLPLFLAHIYRVSETKRPLWEIFFSPRLIGAGLIFLAVFVLGSPYVVLNFPKFIKDFKWQSGHLATVGHFGSSTEQTPLLFYLQYGFKENVGVLSQFLILGGLALGFARRQKRDLILFSYPLVLFILIVTWKARATRYLFPMAPFFILIGAVFLDAVVAAIGRKIAPAGADRKRRIAFAGVSVFLVAGILAPSALRLAKFDAALAGTDSRTRAKEWIDYNIPKGARIALESYGPPISREHYSVLYRHELSDTDLEFLASQDIEYAVISDQMSARFIRYPEDYPQQAAFYQALDREGTLVKTIEPLFKEPLLEMHSVQIKIYRLSRAPAPGFPVNFRSYVQNVTMTRGTEGDWEVRTAILVAGGLGVQERVANPYVRVSAADGRELSRVVIRSGDVPTDGAWSAEATGVLPDVPEGAVVDLGYEYILAPNPITFEPEEPLIKEFRLPAAVDRGSRDAGRWSCGFWFAAVPAPGGDYFQITTLVPKSQGALLQSRVFGPALRHGGGRITSPYVLIQGAAGSDVKKVVLYPGRLGAFDSDQPGPIQRQAVIPRLPENYRLSIGHENGADKNRPGVVTGPFRLELPRLPGSTGPRSGL
jgi:4-amino-4-deoxy-L-arabinose transferase-like glycosyltransferase